MLSLRCSINADTWPLNRKDITIVATSSMVHKALETAKLLEQDGISAEVGDPRTLVPLDRETIVTSARNTGRVIVMRETMTAVLWRRSGLSALSRRMGGACRV